MPRVGAGLHTTRERRGASIERGAAFGVEIGGYRGVIRVPLRIFQRLLPERPTTSSSTRFESIAERKLPRRQLTEDGNVEISGWDLGRVPNEGGADRPGASQFDP